ncbi:hypothetical protein FJV76_13175 [Mesorhizobium sp. WSM4303]|nr:hypothetical protein FJV77_07285 [Mesorhizobium sp. WSM4306]TRD04251.1 hypothetical protein FJV76_13175 [Mesorhizobium sp. WSM4303]
MSPRRESSNHCCEHDGCGKDAGWGFAKPRQTPHWFCFEAAMASYTCRSNDVRQRFTHHNQA